MSKKVLGYPQVIFDYDCGSGSYFENHIKEVSNWTYVDEGISGTSVNKRDSFKRMIGDSKKENLT